MLLSLEVALRARKEKCIYELTPSDRATAASAHPPGRPTPSFYLPSTRRPSRDNDVLEPSQTTHHSVIHPFWLGATSSVSPTRSTAMSAPPSDPPQTDDHLDPVQLQQELEELKADHVRQEVEHEQAVSDALTRVAELERSLEEEKKEKIELKSKEEGLGQANLLPIEPSPSTLPSVRRIVRSY